MAMAKRTQMDTTAYGTRAGQATREQIADYIRDYTAANGHAPYQREIAAGCYLGLRTVQYELDRMEALGMIERVGCAHRSLRVAEQGA